jgi:V/A-type H+/Na+-transporting ATPase subunit K
MVWLVTFMTLNVVAIIALGIYFELRPMRDARTAPRWLKASMGSNLLLFVVAEGALLLLGMRDAMAQATAVAVAKDVSVGYGLAVIGVGLPTAVATIAAGIAVGPVGAASLAVIAEKPEVFGRTLIYLGLAEGIAIYGLVVTILLLGKI